MATTGAVRRTRSDSVRNRIEILDQAERHFTDFGVSASLEAVARDAGVGSATLYRHFPTREALLAEVLSRRAAQFVDERERVDQLEDGLEALEQWLAALVHFFGAFDGLPGPLRTAFFEEHNPLAVTCTGYIEITDRLVRRAQAEGKVRDDVGGRDLFLMALAVCWVRGSSLADTMSEAQLLRLIRAGYAEVDQ